MAGSRVGAYEILGTNARFQREAELLAAATIAVRRTERAIRADGVPVVATAP